MYSFDAGLSVFFTVALSFLPAHFFTGSTLQRAKKHCMAVLPIVVIGIFTPHCLAKPSLHLAFTALIGVLRY